MTLPPHEAKQMIETSESFLLVTFDGDTSIFSAHRNHENTYEKSVLLLASAIYSGMKKTDKSNQEFISDLIDEVKYVDNEATYTDNLEDPEQ
jgi:hypothetical protein